LTSPLSQEANEQSLDLLQRAARPWGFAASPDFDHYDALWVRDAAVAVLGATATEDGVALEACNSTLNTITRATSENGHVPAVIWDDAGKRDWGEGGVVDTNAWFVIASEALFQRTGDAKWAAMVWPTITRAIGWLAARDITGTGIVSAAPSTDWMDSSLTRSGRTLHLNALYAWAVRSAGVIAQAVGDEPPIQLEDLANRINLLFWPEPGRDFLNLHSDGLLHTAIVESHRHLAAMPRKHYVSHVIHSAFVDRCDVLANLVAILAGVAERQRAASILDFLHETGVDRPYPSKTWPEPIAAGDPMLDQRIEERLDPRWRNPPHAYHNAAVWPYVGALHAAAAARTGEAGRALELLHRTAEANAAGGWRFSEWLHGQTGEPLGAPSQTWNAGAFLYAYRLVANNSA
jgi:glycogen debranching enzyme